MQIVINPGSGPVENACEQDAIENIKHFITDCKDSNINWVRLPNRDYHSECNDGRYAFLLWSGMICHEIQMPGIPLEKVRYMNAPNQNAWDYPRLYVDGSSWLWEFAIKETISCWDLEVVAKEFERGDR